MYDGAFTITENGYGYSPHIVRLNVTNIDALPWALQRLVELGYDLTDSLTALQQAIDAQRKRKEYEESGKAFAKACGEDQ